MCAQVNSAKSEPRRSSPLSFKENTPWRMVALLD
jgi:hypothetical protein